MVGSKKPFISVQCVRETLDALLYSSKAAQINALHTLTVVDEFLAQPDFPPFENARNFALSNVLTLLITQEFQQLRYKLNLSPPSPDASIQSETENIRRDGKTEAAHLLTWAYLYYRYVRVDLNISPDDYANLVQLDKRTLRRYLTRGFEALTEKLVIEEWKARSRSRQRRLYSSLPIIPTVKLFGRDAVFEQFYYAYHKGQRLFLITGTVGSGKSVFTQELVRRLIENPSEPVVEHVVWINTPVSGDALMAEIYEKVSPHAETLDIRDNFLLYRTIIVIENLSYLSTPELEKTLAYLSSAEIILTNDVSIETALPLVHLPLHDLDYQDARAYIKWLYDFKNQQPEPANTDFIEDIYAQVGGNPLAIKLMVNTLETDSSGSHLNHSTQHLYQRLFDRLPPPLQRVWIVFAILPSIGLTRETLTHLLGITSYQIAQLLNSQIITGSIDHNLFITEPAKSVIVNASKTMPEVKTLIDAEISALNRMIEQKPSIELFPVIEAILIHQFPVLSQSVIDRWLSYLEQHSAIKQSANWLTILENQFQHQQLNHKYWIEYGCVLRRFHHWERAQLMLEQVVLDTGKQGDFVSQSRAMLELGVLFRIRGAYDKAAKLLNEAAKIAARFQNNALLTRIKLEYAQISVSQLDGESALAHLLDLPASGESLVLRGEAYLLIEAYSEGLEDATGAVKFLTLDRLNTSIVYILIGRLYLGLENYPAAHQYLMSAITLLEVMNQPLELARAWMNLALVYIGQNDFVPAHQLLLQAEAIQVKIRDDVGLVFTQHNLKWLNDQASR